MSEHPHGRRTGEHIPVVEDKLRLWLPQAQGRTTQRAMKHTQDGYARVTRPSWSGPGPGMGGLPGPWALKGQQDPML